MIAQLSVQGKKIQILEVGNEKYISLTDMCVEFGEASVLIASWLRRKGTIEFIGLWEQLHNPSFNSHEFVGFELDGEHRPYC